MLLKEVTNGHFGREGGINSGGVSNCEKQVRCCMNSRLICL